MEKIQENTGLGFLILQIFINNRIHITSTREHSMKIHIFIMNLNKIFIQITQIKIGEIMRDNNSGSKSFMVVNKRHNMNLKEW